MTANDPAGSRKDRTPSRGPRHRLRRGPARLSPRTVAKALTVVVSVATVILSGTGWIGYRHISAGITTSAALAGEPSSTGPKQNILIMGVDSRRDQHGRPLPQQMYDALHAGDADAGEYDSDALIVLHRARSVATKRAEGTVMFIGALRIGEAHQRGSTLQFVHCERLRVEA